MCDGRGGGYNGVLQNEVEVQRGVDVSALDHHRFALCALTGSVRETHVMQAYACVHSTRGALDFTQGGGVPVSAFSMSVMMPRFTHRHYGAASHVSSVCRNCVLSVCRVCVVCCVVSLWRGVGCADTTQTHRHTAQRPSAPPS